MIILPVSTPRLSADDDLVAMIKKHADVKDGDVLVLSSKVIALTEGATINLSALTVSDEARSYAEQTGRSPEFMEAVLRETKRMHGRVLGTCPTALLTEMNPSGIEGSLLAPNAGLDESNVQDGHALGLPHDPVASAVRIRSGFDGTIGVIVSDSCCHVRRWGVSAYALAVAGLDPFKSEIGHKDLFDHEMRVTVEAQADQLATVANMLMGNANQSTPAAIIREHGIPMAEFAGWVKGMNKDEDLFRDLFKK